MSMVKDSYIYKISRRGRKLQGTDDTRLLLALPKEVPERTWADILQKEENELICFDIREDILEEALSIGYVHYMEKQTTYFTVFCTAKAWLKLIDWHFYRHDPGEDPSAYPPCYIPQRLASWTPDELPDPCEKDSWSRHGLKVVEECPDEPLLPHFSRETVQMPVIDPIPKQYWFPGKVNLTTDYYTLDGEKRRHVMSQDSLRKRPSLELVASKDWRWYFLKTDVTPESSTSSKIGAESEVLQRITDYGLEEQPSLQVSRHSSLKPPTPVESSLHGAGDSVSGDSVVGEPVVGDHAQHRRRFASRSKSKCWLRGSAVFRPRLPPLVAASMSNVSLISDCRLRNLRLDTQFELSSEKLNTPMTEQTRKK